MGVEPFLIASSLKLIISQRLVKRLCDKCATPYRLHSDVLKKRVNDYIEGVIDEKAEDIDFYEAKGCERCKNLGFKGRMAIHETLVMHEDLDPLILEKSSVHEIEEKAKELGMITIMQDGILKAATGKTSIDEVMKLI